MSNSNEPSVLHEGGASPAKGRRYPWLALIVVVTCVTYLPALRNPFIYDDRHLILMNALIKEPGHLSEFFHGGISSTSLRGHTRPLTMLSIVLNYRMGGGDPFVYRLTNLLLHLICTVLAWAFLRRLLAAFPLGRRAPLAARDANRAALVAAAFFAIHPINSLSVLMVWKRTTVLSTIFSLLILLVLCRLRGIGDARETRPRRRLALTVALPLFMLIAMGCKEVAVVLPVLVLLLEVWPRPDAMPWNRARVLEVGLLQAAQWLVVLPWLTFLFPHYAAGLAEITLWPYLLTQAKVLWFYLAMIVHPGLLAASYDMTVAYSLKDGWALAGGLGLAATMAGALVCARRASLVGLSILWILVALAPTSSLAPNPLLVDEDRCYLAFLPLWGLAGIGVVWLTQDGRWRRIAAAILCLAGLVGAAMATTIRTITWNDSLVVWVDALKKYPNSYMAHRNICSVLARQKDNLRLAEAECRRAALGPPPDPGSAISLAAVLVSAGRYPEALRAARAATRALPEASYPAQLAGHAEWAQGAPERAIAHYERALRLEPRDDESRLYLAKCYQELGRHDDARQMLDRLVGSPLLKDPVGGALAAEIRRQIAATPARSD